MKTNNIRNYAVAILFLCIPMFQTVQAQIFNTAKEALCHVVDNAQEIIDFSDQAIGLTGPLQTAINTGNVPQVNAIVQQIRDLLQLIEERSDEIITGASQAGQLDPSLNVQPLLNLGSNIEAEEDFVNIALDAVVAAVNIGDTSGALTALQDARQRLRRIKRMARRAKRIAENLKAGL